MKICPRCGKVNLDTDNFCTGCGQPLASVQVQPEAPQSAPQQGWTAQSVQPEAPARPIQPPYQPAQQTPPQFQPIWNEPAPPEPEQTREHTSFWQSARGWLHKLFE